MGFGMPEAATRTIQTLQGPMLAFRGDRFITACLDAYGELSPAERDMLVQLARPGMTVVEVGSNIGAHTIPLARRCHPGRLYAFEPQQRVFQVLCANLALNGVENVFAYPEGCAEASGTATFPDVDYSSAVNVGGIDLGGDGAPGSVVRLIALDDLNLATLGLLKVDAEGFEIQVLQGAARTIARCRPRIYIENDRPDRQEALISLLDGMGYRLYWHLPPLVDDKHQAQLFGQRFVSINMVCVPRESGTVVQNLEHIDPANWSHPLGRGVAETIPPP